jgi:hypothetical protein
VWLFLVLLIVDAVLAEVGTAAVLLPLFAHRPGPVYFQRFPPVGPILKFTHFSAPILTFIRNKMFILSVVSTKKLRFIVTQQFSI